jgi:hypothetical protein
VLQPDLTNPAADLPDAPPPYRYVEELVRSELAKSLGGWRGMVESALPFVAFTVAWVLTRQLYPSLGAAFVVALVAGLTRLVQRQSLRFVLQAVVPTAIAALVATRTGRAEDVFLPGILYNGALALLSVLSIAVRRPLLGFLVGTALNDPTGWLRDRGLVQLSSRLTAVLAVPYVLRFVVQLPLFLTGQVLWLGVAKVVLGWPLLVAVLFVMGLLLSKGRTPTDPAPA